MRVLVLGGTGLVGWAIRRLVADQNGNGNGNGEWIFVSSKQADLRNMKETCALLKRTKPTHVIHLAANVGGLFKNLAHNADMLMDNVLINTNVIKACHRYNVQRGVFFLSTCIFPDHPEAGYPMAENDLHEGPPHPSNYGYAYSKRILDTLCQAFNQQYGREYIAVIPTNIYGPHDNFSLENGHIIPALIHKAHNAKKAGGVLTVAGTGKPLRQFMYADDIARLCIWALTSYDSTERLVFAPPASEEVCIDFIVKCIATNMGIEYVYDTDRSDGQYRKTVSNSNLMAALNRTGAEFKFTPLEEGIKKTIEWFNNSWSSIRVRV